MQMLFYRFTQEQSRNEICSVVKTRDSIFSLQKLSMNSQIWVTLKAKMHPGKELLCFQPTILDSWNKIYKHWQVTSKASERQRTRVWCDRAASSGAASVIMNKCLDVQSAFWFRADVGVKALCFKSPQNQSATNCQGCWCTIHIMKPAEVIVILSIKCVIMFKCGFFSQIQRKFYIRA